MIETHGTYRCNDCEVIFQVGESNVVKAYDEWQPTCPICGTKNDIETLE